MPADALRTAQRPRPLARRADPGPRHRAHLGDGAPEGAVWVLAVAPGGRAAAAGLRVGDLLLSLDAQPLAGTLQLLDALERAVRERARVTLQLRRGGALTTLNLPMDTPR